VIHRGICSVVESEPEVDAFRPYEVVSDKVLSYYTLYELEAHKVPPNTSDSTTCKNLTINRFCKSHTILDTP
jgi:hypothetical protein